MCCCSAAAPWRPAALRPGSTPGDTTIPPTTAPTTTTAPLSTALGGDYSVRYGTDSTATAHVSGDTVTVSAGPGFRIEGANCTLATNTVLAVFTGSGTHYTGRHSTFGSSCRYSSYVGSSLDLNADGSLSITSPTGTHLFTKRANAPTPSENLAAEYDLVYASTGTAALHLSGDVATLSVTSPFSVEGGSCALPVRTVLGTFTGTGIHRTGSHSTFGSASCLYSSYVGSSLYVNSDRTLTVTGATGPHLLTWRTPITTTSTPATTGDYGVRYGTDGVASIRQSGTNRTVSVSTPFGIEGSSCLLPASTVIANLTGSGTRFTGSHSTFGSATCQYSSYVGSTMYVNSDQSITLTTATGPHFFERL